MKKERLVQYRMGTMNNSRLLKERMEERRQIEISASIQYEVLLYGLLVWCWFWFGFLVFFLIKGQGALCLISTSQQVGEYFIKTPSQIFSPRVHLTIFKGKWPCPYQLLCFCSLTKIKDPVRLLRKVSHRRTVWRVTISCSFLLLEATQPWSCT